MNVNNIVDKIKALIMEHINENIDWDIKVLKSDNFGFKLEVDGVDLEKIKEIEKLNTRLSKRYGFTQNIVGMEFEGYGNESKTIHKIVGFKTSNRKYPIITTETVTGKSYKFPVESVKSRLGGDKLINRTANLDKLLEK